MADGGEIKKSFALTLDLSRPISNREFTLVEGDTGNVLVISLTDGGTPVDLSGCRVIALFSRSDGLTVSQDSGSSGNGVSIAGDGGNIITIDLFASSFAPGMVECEIQVYSGANLATLVTSAKFNFRCRRGILNGDTIEAVEQYPILTSLIADVSALQSAGEAMTAAEADRAAAETARISAEDARQNFESARSAAETSRTAAETARTAAETARATAESARSTGYTALEGRLDAAIDDADDIVAALETEAAAITGLGAVNGIVRANGEGAVCTATADTDYATPASVAAKCDKPLRMTAVSVPAADFVSDTTYADYPYRAAVAVTGATASMMPEVTFSLTDAVGGILAPVAEAYDGGVYIYASEAPAAAVTIATVTVWKAV